MVSHLTNQYFLLIEESLHDMDVSHKQLDLNDFEQHEWQLNN